MKKLRKINKKEAIRQFVWKYKQWILVFVIFLLELFLRFYKIEEQNPFGWDQVDNAWAAKNLIVNHSWPLVGMVAKGNSGFYIGPVYYYLVSIVYWFTKLDPIASGIFAGLTSIFTFWVLFFVTKKLFSFNVAVIAIFIHTVTFLAIIFDRVQWPVDFIPSVSLLIFYFLYQVIIGQPKYIIWLASAVGFAFQLHFTAIFFPIIIFLSLPLFPRTKETIKYIILSLLVLTGWFIPNIIYELLHKNSQSVHMTKYLRNYYHGFHLRRMLQIMGDGFIQFQPFLPFPFLSFLRFLLLPLFIIVFLFRQIQSDKIKICYLMILWFLIPWFIFSTYKGEISDYYFSINRFISLIIISYLLAKIYDSKLLIAKVVVIVFLLYYGIINLNEYLSSHNNGLKAERQIVLHTINSGEKIQYTDGMPESYLYYYYMRRRGENVY